LGQRLAEYIGLSDEETPVVIIKIKTWNKKVSLV
jgi:hypothetical protein